MFPAESVIPAIKASLEANRDVVLCAPPGSGKTTCVPPALLDANFLKGRKIVVLEPRRLAARSAAAYVARKLGEETGGTVGYQVRLDRRITNSTRIEFITEGLLVQRLLGDPELSDIGLVVFDEFHERSLACDQGFAMALEVRRVLRPDLRLLVMSATLDTKQIAEHLGDADVHTASARMFPVETRYLEMESTAPIHVQMAGAVRRMLNESTGSILCFLPGEGEIKRCAEELADLPDVYPLYGAMSHDEQDRAVESSLDKRIVLATSIAETSLTIEGVTTVIDSGLMRVRRFSPRSGMSRLETLRITRDRAEQRRGRAGRVRPGICLRLWTTTQDRRLIERSLPEIVNADLAPVVLSCAMWGTVASDGIPWLTVPPDGLWNSAVELLKSLGALSRDGLITEHGKRMARLPVHPRLANMIIETGTTELAAILEEGAPHHITDIRNVRITSRMKVLARQWGAAQQMEAGDALAFAFPDRVAKNRGNGSFQMSCGRGAYLDCADPLSNAEYLVICDLDDRGGNARIHLAAPISEEAIEDIFAKEIEEISITEWDKREECVRCVRERRFGRMTLKRVPLGSADPELVQAALFDGIRQKGVSSLEWTASQRQMQCRIMFLRKVLGGKWPDVSNETLAAEPEKFFTPFTDGIFRWQQFAKIDIAAVLEYALMEAACSRNDLDRLAPTKIMMPSGSAITIHYEEGDPFVQVRLQECFGMLKTPEIAGVPLLMKLLSPAQRPVQVTRDLASFWRDTYQLVRKDLRGRYPKHYWPEDPFSAVATRRVRP